MSRVAEWSPYTTYIVGDVVNYIGIRYTATAVNVNTPPLPATPIWVGVPPSTGVNVVASSTNATMYPTFVSATSGTLPVLVDSDFTYNPALGDISINDTVKIQSQTSGSRIAIGYLAGETSQSQSAVAVGDRAGQTSQGLNAVAVGVLAGDGTQGNYAVAVGNLAGGTNQGMNAVAVGVGAGLIGQGASSIAIGQQAGQTNQHSNSIVLNASGSALDTDGTNRLFIKPVRNASTSDVMFYNSTSGEVSYSSAPVPSSITVSDTSLNATYYPMFANATTGSVPVNVDSTFTYNPSTDTLTATNFNGLATTATNVDVKNVNTNGIHYPLFVFGSSGALGTNADSGWTYNPSLGDFTIADTMKVQSITSGSRIAIGGNAGLTGQGASSIAIGQQAGETNQHANSIILNASGSALDSNGTSRFFVKPIRNVALTNTLFYDSSTGEIGYSVASSATSSMISGTGSGTNSTNTRYCGIDSGSYGADGLSATEDGANSVIPLNCNISNLYIRVSGAVGSAGNGYSFVLRKNGGNTVLSTTILGSNTTGSDLADSIAFTSGDLLSILVSPVGSPNTNLNIRWFARLTPT